MRAFGTPSAAERSDWTVRNFDVIVGALGASNGAPLLAARQLPSCRVLATIHESAAWRIDCKPEAAALTHSSTIDAAQCAGAIRQGMLQSASQQLDGGSRRGSERPVAGLLTRVPCVGGLLTRRARDAPGR
jgi:hypothetical protein